MTEAELLGEVLLLAARHDVLAFHCYDARQATGAGFPDLVLCGTGHTVFAELKTATGSTSSQQTQWKWRLVASGEVYYKWLPRHLADGTVESVMKHLHLRTPLPDGGVL